VERTLRRLPGLLAALGATVAAVGVLWRPSGRSVPVVTTRGATAELAGTGLYRYDTVFTAAGNTAVDAVLAAFGIPLLITAWVSYRGRSQRGSVLLAGTLGYLLYVYANYAFGVAFNPLYVAYVTLLSTSLFGFIAALNSVNRDALAAVAADPDVPHRTLSRFLLTSAAVTAAVLLQPVVTALLRNAAPDKLDVYTTPVTFSLDLGIVAPSAALAGLLVRRREPLGYLLAAPLLMTIVLLLPTIALSTALQAAAGISFTTAQVVGPIAGFGVLGAVGARLLVQLLRAVPDVRPAAIGVGPARS
jgi:hypothetical protein